MKRQVATTFVLVALLWPTTAHAHANFLSSSPAAGAALADPPTRVVLSFSEEPDPTLSKVELLNTGGQAVAVGPLRTNDGSNDLVLPIHENLPDGTYTVDWVVVSAVDSHYSEGSLAFGVGEAPDVMSASSASSSPPPSIASIVGKSLLYLGIVLAIGAVFAGLWVIGPTFPGRKSIALSAGLATAAGAITMLVAESAAVDVPLRDVLGSTAGRPVWLLSAALFTLALGFEAAVTKYRWTLVLFGLAAVATALARSVGGHAASGSPAWGEEGLQTAHIVAAGVWVGGFIPILALLRASRTGPPPRVEVRRFSAAATCAVLAIVVTGVLRVLDEAEGVGGVWSMLSETSYGMALIVKLALVAVLIALGAWNRFRSISRLERGDQMLSRVIRAEALAVLAILVTTGVLTGLNPQPPPDQAEIPTSISASGADFATTMRVQLSATPGVAGPNEFVVHLTDYDTGEPFVVDGVGLGFEPVGRSISHAQIELAQEADGVWNGSGNQMSLAGVWHIYVRVRDGATTSEVPLILTTRAPGGQVVSSTSVEGGPDIVAITLEDGLQLQSYFDPGTAGQNELHITAFDTSGAELPLSNVIAVLTPEGSAPAGLGVPRYDGSEGHFSAPVALSQGSTQVVIVATKRDGTILQGSFTQEVP
jgi:copper transport protein